jgi:MFS transporter, CP family, cyanate transporter
MRSPEYDGRRREPLPSHMLRLLILWLAGTGMRMTILAVPPLIPLIHDEFRMSETQIGILAGLPVALFACAAVPGSLLIVRFGAVAAVTVGLMLTGIGSALRGAAPNVAAFYAATIVTGFGVAVMQPAMPPLVRAWLPQRIAFGTAVYANGLLIGEILPVMTMLPLVLPLTGERWRLALVFWGLPCLGIAALIMARGRGRAAERGPAPAPRGWPQWNSGLLWRLGLMLGGVNSAYFTSNHFLPDYLDRIGRGDLIGPALTALNAGQLPGSFLLLALAGRVERHAGTYLVFGGLTFAGVLGIILGGGVAIVAAAAVIGFASASVLILILALPPLLSRQEDVPAMAAGIFTISYSCAVFVPVVSGLLWDATGVPQAAFVPVALSVLLVIALAPTLGLSRLMAAA